MGGEDMNGERLFDLIIWAFIAVMGLVAAYVCFGILSSEASGQYQQYSVGGAIAGALVSWSVLTTVYLQLRGSSEELKELRNRTEELQQKLIRGAPRPPGFITEVDERQRIVLARPEVWQPKGGTIFDLELASEKMGKTDEFAAAFRCYFLPIDKNSTPSQKKYYENELKEAEKYSDLIVSFSHELVQIGDEMVGVESLKLLLHHFVETTITKSRDTGRIERNWHTISKVRATGKIHYITPSRLKVNKPEELSISGFGFRKNCSVYINGEKRDTQFIDNNNIKVQLEKEDVSYSKTLEIAIENQNTRGLKSDTYTVQVDHEMNFDKTETDDEIEDGFDQQSMEQQAPEESFKKKITEESDLNENQDIHEDVKKTLIQEVARMRVLCYHEQLKKIYIFEFWDDIKDFQKSSAEFNRVLASTRFLE
ncbi:IPT/TIG domain-containing protein [Aliifodinibius sp. S!AR15-10]|uniref:IPT/TIG domain-containing protein n=1 Tax=Aliifodinibius sp. S!AR15-10 TaxID=2950437 RepID=UPI0028610CE4|nr:IPT/TIG domain-containing protein [Aliifodinibius sp. S!AR15-10]MDR8389523.1 IPT/TIG domain-containing protein [Aliifodinibius sp. S!AR15-10]